MLDPKPRLHPIPGERSNHLPEAQDLPRFSSTAQSAKKVGRNITSDCGCAGFYGHWCECCTGTARRTVLAEHRHQMPPNPKPQDHHRADVDSCAALQIIHFVRNRAGQIRVPGELGPTIKMGSEPLVALVHSSNQESSPRKGGKMGWNALYCTVRG